jgi:hypothetical protein
LKSFRIFIIGELLLDFGEGLENQGKSKLFFLGIGKNGSLVIFEHWKEVIDHEFFPFILKVEFQDIEADIRVVFASEYLLEEVAVVSQRIENYSQLMTTVLLAPVQTPGLNRFGKESVACFFVQLKGLNFLVVDWRIECRPRFILDHDRHVVVSEIEIGVFKMLSLKSFLVNQRFVPVYPIIRVP